MRDWRQAGNEIEKQRKYLHITGPQQARPCHQSVYPVVPEMAAPAAFRNKGVMEMQGHSRFDAKRGAGVSRLTGARPPAHGRFHVLRIFTFLMSFYVHAQSF